MYISISRSYFNSCSYVVPRRGGGGGFEKSELKNLNGEMPQINFLTPKKSLSDTLMGLRFGRHLSEVGWFGYK